MSSDRDDRKYLAAEGGVSVSRSNHGRYGKGVMLTYLDRSPSEYRLERRQCLMFIGFVGIGSLAIETAPRGLPGKVVDDCQVLAPKDGGAMGHGQDACVYKAFERSWPCVSRAY